MSRFAALDLKALPELSSLTDLDFDKILEDRLVALEARLNLVFEPSKVSEIMALARNIAASPMRYLNESAAARELYVENRINKAIRSVLLSSATGGDLDQQGANRGVVRKELDASDPDNVIFEGDDEFRARIQLAIEAWSPHGTEGSYAYWALDADDRVLDVAVYGPNDPIDPPIPSAEPKIVVLSSEGDGSASDALCQTVYDHCIPDKRRTIGDKLSVVSVVPVPYAISAKLHLAAAGSELAVLAAAQAALDGFLTQRFRIGRKMFRTSIAAALAVDGVVDVELIAPAADVDVGPFEAPHCTDKTITTQTYAGGWRDV